MTDRLSTLFPWPNQTMDSRCFLNQRPSQEGPGAFINKLMKQFRQQGILVTYQRLRASKGALLTSISWGNWFYRLCKRWNVRTVLRVDGFYIPTYFDNRTQPPKFQDRRLTLDKMVINYRLQQDLFLADFVIYQSGFSKQMADHFLYNRKDSFDVIFNGTDLSQFYPVREHGGKRCLITFGLIRDEYMLGTILPVFGSIYKEWELDLVIIGPLDSINRETLEEFRRGDPISSERIKWIGPVANSELPRYLQDADVLLHPRLGDSCPNTVIEAMACGLPVVCGSWGGTAELVGNAGVVVQTGPWEYGKKYQENFADGVVQVLQNLDRYKAVARSRAEAEFDIRNIATKYLQALGVQE